jgi:uncharacterized protein YggU (UPF0235/DUF167 family)
LTTAPPLLNLSVTREGLAFWIVVTPRASREHVGGSHGGALRVAVTEPPVEGEANAACVRALAHALGVRRDAIGLAANARGRRKRVVVQGEAKALEQRLLALAEPAGSD